MTANEKKRLSAKLARIIDLVQDAHTLLGEEEGESSESAELRTDLNLILSAARDAEELAGQL